MQISLLFIGTFMDTGSRVMVTMPIFMPIVNALGIDPVWFGVLVLLNMEMSSVTPPVGMPAKSRFYTDPYQEKPC
jgi:TRAP-type C4-dicarboxylate transport system permease large subunit